MKQDSLPRMTRKTFLKTATVFSVSALSLDMGAAHPRSESLEHAASERSPVMVENSHWQLGLDPGAGLKAQVVHKPSGMVLAQGAYSYSMGNTSFGEAQESQDGRTKTVRLTGKIPGGIELQHEYRVPAE